MSTARRLSAVLFICVFLAGVASAESVRVPMRDGVELATDYYLPTEGGPAFPVVLARSVYGRAAGPQIAKGYTDRGIAFVVQDTRGRGDSGGEKDMVFGDDGWGERQDGFDTVEWIRKQPWCNGKVGAWGGSALGITQVMLAGSGADVQAQCILVASSNFYDQLSYQGGVFRKALLEGWLKAQKSLHILDIWQVHPTYDDFWALYNAEAVAEQIKAPAVHVGGWFDIFAKGTINNFVTRQHNGGPGAKGNQKLIMGPWPHGVVRKVGELEFPENFSFDLGGYEKRFMDHWLKGVDNGIDMEPAVHYYTMGACGEDGAPGNEWRTADDWPPFPTVETPYYLGADGALSTDAGTVEAGQLEYAFDPNDPCPTHGGQNLLLPAGSFDQRKVSGRKDVLRFQTEPLEQPVEVTGAVRLRLYVSTDAPDTDFTAKLVDIYPDGREMLILDNVRRLKFRNGFEKPDPLPAGEIGELEIDLWSTSLVFNKGHRIGVQVSSSNFPRFELNPNTGEDFPKRITDPDTGETKYDKSSFRTARNTVHTGGKTPSALILPIRPATAE
jgi:predicted acyl esterase